MKTRYDAVIIGAGIIGAAVAAQLAESGYSVLILERGVPASGASGGNCGQISISDRTEPWHMKLALRSLEYYREVLSKEYPIEYDASGGSITLSGAFQLTAGQAAMEQLQAYGVKAEIVRGSAVNDVEPAISPAALDGLLYCPLEGKLNPFQTTLAFLDKAQHAGAVLMRNTPVTAFEKSGDQIVGIKTAWETYSAGWVLNCAGPRAAHVGKLAGVPVPVRFHKGTAFVSQPVAPMIRGPVVSGESFLAPPAVRPNRAIGFGTVQTANGSILIAQSTEVCEIDDKSVNMPSLQLVARAFLRYYPQLHDLQIVRAWVAVTTYTEDGLPVLGTAADARNFFTVAGFKGAFTTAPAIAALTKDALDGRLDSDYLCCTPDRTGSGVVSCKSAKEVTVQ